MLALTDDGITRADGEPAAERRRPAPEGAPASQSSVRTFSGPRTAVLLRVEGERHCFKMRAPLFVSIRYEDGFVHASQRDLPVFGSGPSYATALEDFALYFEAQWEGLVDCEESALTADAIDARRAFVAIAVPFRR